MVSCRSLPLLRLRTKSFPAITTLIMVLYSIQYCLNLLIYLIASSTFLIWYLMRREKGFLLLPGKKVPETWFLEPGNRCSERLFEHIFPERESKLTPVGWRNWKSYYLCSLLPICIPSVRICDVGQGPGIIQEWRDWVSCTADWGRLAFRFAL